MNSYPGKLITFEGVEGSGKSTLMRGLADALDVVGHDVLCTREPGGTELGEAIREVVLRARAHAVHPWTELFLMLASRAQLVRELILPALENGGIVLCDRYMDASVAYQGAGRGIGVEQVEELNRLATARLDPDLSFLVDLDPELGRARLQGPPDRMEKEDLDFHRVVHRAYQDLARRHSSRFELLDGRSEPRALLEAAWGILGRLLPDLPPLPPANP